MRDHNTSSVSFRLRGGKAIGLRHGWGWGFRHLVRYWIAIAWIHCQATTDITNNESEQQGDDVRESSSPMVIAGYLPDYRVAMPQLNQATMFLSDIILFSISPTARGSVGIFKKPRPCCIYSSHFKTVRDALEHRRRKMSEQNGGGEKFDSSANVNQLVDKGKPHRLFLISMSICSFNKSFVSQSKYQA